MLGVSSGYGEHTDLVHGYGNEFGAPGKRGARSLV